MGLLLPSLGKLNRLLFSKSLALASEQRPSVASHWALSAGLGSATNEIAISAVDLTTGEYLP